MAERKITNKNTKVYEARGEVKSDLLDQAALLIDQLRELPQIGVHRLGPGGGDA